MSSKYGLQGEKKKKKVRGGGEKFSPLEEQPSSVCSHIPRLYGGSATQYCQPTHKTSGLHQVTEISLPPLLERHFSSVGEQATTCTMARVQRPGLESDLRPFSVCLRTLCLLCFRSNLSSKGKKPQHARIKGSGGGELMSSISQNLITNLDLLMERFSFFSSCLMWPMQELWLAAVFLCSASLHVLACSASIT